MVIEKKIDLQSIMMIRIESKRQILFVIYSFADYFMMNDVHFCYWILLLKIKKLMDEQIDDHDDECLLYPYEHLNSIHHQYQVPDYQMKISDLMEIIVVQFLFRLPKFTFQ